jgi:hypothetical protein
MVDPRYQFFLQFRMLIIHLVQQISVFLEHVPSVKPVKCMWEQRSNAFSIALSWSVGIFSKISQSFFITDNNL